MTKDRWIKPSATTYGPTALVSIVLETREEPIPGRITSSFQRLEYIAVSCSRWRKGKWNSPLLLRFSDRDEFFNWLESWANNRRRTYIVTPIASNALTLLGFWNRITEIGSILVRQGEDLLLTTMDGTEPVPSISPAGELDSEQTGPVDGQDGRYYFSGLIVTGKTDIVKYSRNGKGYCWCSCRQFFESSEEELANAHSFKWSSAIYGEEQTTAPLRNARDRSLLWLRVFQSLSDWWREIDGGPWGNTVGQLSYSYFRRSIDQKTLLVHGNTLASDVEERALFGGRASLFCRAPIGDVDRWTVMYGDAPKPPDYPALQGHISHVDIRSMYPSLLARELFPVRLLRTHHSLTIPQLEELLTEYGVIADVTLNCTHAEYPYRRLDRILYPVGRFRTTLTGPELSAALSRQEVESVGFASVYLLGRPFEQCANSLLEYRKTARLEENYAFELFIKHLSNALAGKLAQRRYDWVPRPRMVAELDWGQWVSVNYHTGDRAVYRALAGMVFQRIEHKGTQRKMASVFAYLTGYGRQLMAKARQSLPAYAVLSQDTDGLWIHDRGNGQALLERIQMAVEPYEVRQNKSGENSVFLSPSHHWIDGNWTLAGFQIVSVASSELRVQSGNTDNPITRGCDRPPISVRYHREIRQISNMPVDGTIGPDGWIIPPHINSE